MHVYNLVGASNIITYLAQWYSNFYVQGYNVHTAAVTIPKGTVISIAYKRVYN